MNYDTPLVTRIGEALTLVQHANGQKNSPGGDNQGCGDWNCSLHELD